MINQQSDCKCPGCDKQISQQRIRYHIQNCQRYPQTILKDIKRLQHAPSNLIHFLIQEIDLAKQKLIKLYKPVSDKNTNEIADMQLEDLDRLISKINRGPQIVQPNMAIYQSNIVICLLCENKFYSNFDNAMLFYVYDCWDVFCMPCLNKYFDSQFVNQGGNIKCPNKKCSKIMIQQQIKGVMGNQKYQNLYTKVMHKMYNIIQCLKCKQQFQFQQGNPKDAPKKDLSGKQLKPEHARDYAVNRFICLSGSCKLQQCKNCKASPYHLGMTCKQYKDRALLKKCRYCDQPLTQKNASLSNVKAYADICTAKQCQQSMRSACDKINPCGHACYGYKGQTKCLPCLNEKCAQKSPQLLGVNAGQYCAVCYIQALSAAPCVRSSCGHIFHVKCLKKRFEIKWLTPRIFFNFCLCPLCKKWISVSAESELYKPSEQNMLLYQKIQGMALQRLKFQQLQKSDPKLIQKSSQYYGKQKQYSMLIYAYFMCFKCKNPYFGGRKDCVAAMNQAQNAGGSFKAEELICANCCQIPIQNCPKHDKQYIQFKCKFCCNVAQWFCWGNTHFCQPCHKRQCSGDYVSKYTKQQLPKCPGPGACPVGGNHNGNGEQRTLGCAICRNVRDNARKF